MSRRPSEFKTLREAQETLFMQRPPVGAQPMVWVTFHRLCAEVYSAVAKVDVAHQHEAQACAGQEMRQAREIEDQLTANQAK